MVEELKVPIRLSATGSKGVVAEIEAVRQEIEAIQRLAGQAGPEFANALLLEAKDLPLEDVQAFRREFERLAKGGPLMGEVNSELKMTDAILQTLVQDAIKANVALTDVGKAPAGIGGRRAGQGLGTTERGFREFGGLASSLAQTTDNEALRNLGGIMRVGSDIAGAGEFVARFKQEIMGLSRGLQDGTQAASGLIPALSSGTVGMAAMGVAAGGIVVGFMLAKKALDDSSAAVREHIKVLDREIELAQFARSIQGQSAEQLSKQIEENIADINDQKVAQADLVDTSFEAIDAMSKLEKGLTWLADDLGLGGTMEEATKQLIQYNDLIIKQEAQLEILNAQLAEQLSRERALAGIAALQENIEQERAFEQERTTITEEEARKRIQASRDEIAAKEDERAALEKMMADNMALIQRQSSSSGITPAAVEATHANEVYRQRLDEVNQELQKSQEQLASYDSALLRAGQTNDEATAKLEALNKAREDELAHLADLTKQQEQLNQTYAKFSDQIDDLQASRDEDLTKRARQEALASRQSSELAALSDRLSLAQASQAERERQTKIAAVRQEGTSKELQLVAKLNQDELDATRDFNQRMKELKEDLEADLFEAAIENDVNAFLSAQRSGLRAIGRAEGEGTLDQAERQQAAQEQLSELRSQQSAQLTSLQQSGINQVTEVQRIQQEITAAQTRHAKEREALTRQIEEEAFMRHLRDLQMQRTMTYMEMSNLNKSISQSAVVIGQNAAQGVLNAFSQTANLFLGHQSQAFAVNQANTFNVTGANTQQVQQIAQQVAVTAVQGISRAFRSAS